VKALLRLHVTAVAIREGSKADVRVTQPEADDRPHGCREIQEGEQRLARAFVPRFAHFVRFTALRCCPADQRRFNLDKGLFRGVSALQGDV
jgi:hypothetical protein